MDKKSEPAPGAGAAPLEPVKASVHSDLQYVSIQLDGSTYGGWYRVLPDGQMELLALANMHCERRSESTPVEQAQGMLADFIRRARRNKASLNAAAGTLGALLYADPTKARVDEQDWVEVLQSIAVGQPAALRDLYERTHRVVFTLMVRLAGDRDVAEELTLDVLADAWRRAGEYDPADGSVLGWVLNQARATAIASGKLAASPKSSIGYYDEIPERQEHGPWRTDVLRPSLLWPRLVERLALDSTAHAINVHWLEPEWEDVAPGISCKLLATDRQTDLVSMLVRLSPGTDYPPHTHAGREELHLLQGELWIDERKLLPGDYNRAEAGTADKRVWSETGCMCALITSTRDVIS